MPPPPEGADPKKNYRDYVLGTYDGVPKTPGVGFGDLRVAPPKTWERLALMPGGASVLRSLRRWLWPVRIRRAACQNLMAFGASGRPHRQAWLLPRFRLRPFLMQGGFETLLKGGMNHAIRVTLTLGNMERIPNPPEYRKVNEPMCGLLLSMSASTSV